MEKVIPRSINYSDIKPEAIENMVRVVRFTPTATVNSAKANDIVRFQLMGNGFYDPYSAYIKFQVECDMTKMTPNSEALNNKFVGRFLDRSAHSLISRLVIKSQGTELERIEQFDIMAAMVNDMLYSQEQVLLHHFEGFPTKRADIGGIALEAGAGIDKSNLGNIPLLFLGQANQDLDMRYLIDQGFWKFVLDKDNAASSGFPDFLTEAEDSGLGFQFSPATGGKFTNAVTTGTMGSISDLVSNTAYDADTVDGIYSSESSLIFCIPIYSGILGVLQDNKKLLPLSLMPLEVEFTVNPYAFYDVGLAARFSDPRAYTITKFWIYSHMLFFEQELHRSLESVVAENGIFIHFNSFYLAPIATHATSAVLQYAQINIHAKSINSIHFVFIYTGFEATNGVRKLHFVNHNLQYLQLRNGTELTPSEPIEGNQYTGKSQNQHIQFMLETFKAWNKLHDPTTDAAFSPYNYVVDSTLTRPTDFAEMIMQQARLGRCQYAISLEGEELGQDKAIITGRKGLIPFDINMSNATKSHADASFQFIFVKADYIIYVRPDLVVTLLGR